MLELRLIKWVIASFFRELCLHVWNILVLADALRLVLADLACLAVEVNADFIRVDVDMLGCIEVVAVLSAGDSDFLSGLILRLLFRSNWWWHYFWFLRWEWIVLCSVEERREKPLECWLFTVGLLLLVMNSLRFDKLLLLSLHAWVVVITDRDLIAALAVHTSSIVLDRVRSSWDLI